MEKALHLLLYKPRETLPFYDRGGQTHREQYGEKGVAGQPEKEKLFILYIRSLGGVLI